MRLRVEAIYHDVSSVDFIRDGHDLKVAQVHSSPQCVTFQSHLNEIENFVLRCKRIHQAGLPQDPGITVRVYCSRIMSSPNTDHASGEVDAGHTQIRTPLPDQINNGSILFHEASMSNPMPQIASPMESGGSIVGPGGQLAIQGSRSSSLTGGPTVGGTPTATHSRRPSSSSSQLSRTGTFGGLGDGDALDSVIPSSPPGSPRPAPRQVSIMCIDPLL